MKKEITTSLRKSYVQPHCEVLVVAAECQVVNSSGSVPGGSSGTDLGGGQDEEPITVGGAKSSNLWGDTSSSGWDN